LSCDLLSTPASAAVPEPASEAAFEAKLQQCPKAAITFYATWNNPSKAVARTVEEHLKKYPQICFLMVDVDKFSAIAEKYEITAIPYIVFLNKGKKVDDLLGVDLAALTPKILSLADAPE